MSDPINWELVGTCGRTELVVRIFHRLMLLSPEPWIFAVKLSPDPCANECRETGNPELGPLWTSVFLETLVTDTGGKLKLDVLGGGLIQLN